MEDIIEAALGQTDDIERKLEENADDTPKTDEFGAPTCALVGCGPAGIDRIEKLEARTASQTIMPRLGWDATGADVSVRLSLRESTSGEAVSDGYADLDVTLGDEVMDADIVAVTAHLGDLSAGQLAERVCRQLSNEQTVLVIPTIPEVDSGLDMTAQDAFFGVIDAAGTTIPYDLTSINDAYCSADVDTQKEPLQIANSLIAEWLVDVFATFRGRTAAPCLQRLTLYEMLDSGDVSMLYWGWGTRSDGPISLLKDAAAHRLCGGDRRTATGGFGFVRFGHSFTLSEFESLETQSKELLCPDSVAEDRWVVCGDTSPGLGEDCRIALLLTGIDPTSLPFL